MPRAARRWRQLLRQARQLHREPRRCEYSRCRVLDVRRRQAREGAVRSRARARSANARRARAAGRVGAAMRIGSFLRRRSVILSALLAALLLGAWFWLRDSSLVAIKRVTITGVSGPDAAQIRAALSKAARNMTTLHIRMDQFHMAVGPYPVVKYLQ